MAVSRALRRLLRIRDLEEEQSRLALETATGQLNLLEQALVAAIDRGRRGRRLIDASARTGELLDRLAGLEEGRSSLRCADALAPRIEDAKPDVADLREEFLARRVARRQAETLIEESEAREAIETGRRSQQSLDDWYSSRLYTHAGSRKPREKPVSPSETPSSPNSEFTNAGDAVQEPVPPESRHK